MIPTGVALFVEKLPQWIRRKRSIHSGGWLSGADIVVKQHREIVLSTPIYTLYEIVDEIVWIGSWKAVASIELLEKVDGYPYNVAKERDYSKHPEPGDCFRLGPFRVKVLSLDHPTDVAAIHRYDMPWHKIGYWWLRLLDQLSFYNIGLLRAVRRLGFLHTPPGTYMSWRQLYFRKEPRNKGE